MEKEIITIEIPVRIMRTGNGYMSSSKDIRFHKQVDFYKRDGRYALRVWEPGTGSYDVLLDNVSDDDEAGILAKEKLKELIWGSVPE